MRYQSVVIWNTRTGFRARLSVGALYKGFEVLEISKVEVPEEGPKLSPESVRLLFGSYELVLRSPKGIEYDLSNNQEFASACFCMNRTVQKIDLVPGGIDSLTHNSNTAEFEAPLC